MLLRWSAFMFFVAGLAIASSSPARAQSTNADRVYEALKAANPEVVAQEKFIRDYVSRLDQPIGALDNFVAVIDGSSKSACNLLCQAHLMPAFFRTSRVNALDLVRYVFTSTCYGVINDEQHRGKALDDLEAVALTSYFLNETKLAKSQDESYILRRVLGDAVKAMEVDFPAITKYSRLRQLWQAGRPGDNTRSNYPHRTSPLELAAQYTACRKVPQ
jgi:hypothetical protein